MKVKMALVMSAGRRQRHHDRPVDAQVPAAVQPRGLVEFLGQPAHELDHEEDEERVGGEVLADQQRSEGVDQLQLLEHHVLRNDQYVVREQQRPDHDGEHRVAPGEPDLGEGVGRQRAGDDDTDHGTDRDIGRVQEELPDRDVGDAVGEPPVVVGDRVGRQEVQRADDVLARLERRADRPHDRVEDHREDGEGADVPGEGAGEPAVVRQWCPSGSSAPSS